MGRRSKLNDTQIQSAIKRVLEGESMRAVARSIGMGESSFRARISAQVNGIKDAANQIVSAEQKLAALPIPAQITAHNLAAKLRAISENLGQAAYYNSLSAHRMAQMAHSETAKIDETAPLADVDVLKGISALTRMSNESAELGIRLIATQAKNQDIVEDKNSSSVKFYLPENGR